MAYVKARVLWPIMTRAWGPLSDAARPAVGKIAREAMVGPSAALVAMLGAFGWRLESPTAWTSPSGDTWVLDDEVGFLTRGRLRPLLDEVEHTVSGYY